MNTKDRLIEKLLKVAKKHKILTYPVLAVVSIISVIDYFFSWTTGAGKRFVAVVMVLVMLVSQSYFLTSSATELVDTSETWEEQKALQEQDEESSLVDDSAVEESTEAASEVVESTEQVATTEATASSSTSETTEENSVVEDSIVTDDTTFDDIANTENVTQEESSESEIPTVSEEMPEAETADVTISVAFWDSDLTTVYSGTSNGSNPAIIKKDDGSYYVSSNALGYANDKMNTVNDYFDFYGWYTGENGTGQKITADTPVDTLLSGNHLQLYSYRSLKAYKVTIDGQNSSSDSIGTISDSAGNVISPATDGTYTIPVKGGSGTFTVTGATKLGYCLTGATSPATVGSNSSMTVTVSGTSYKQTVKYKWEADTYYLKYVNEAGTQIGELQQVTYDDSSNFLNMNTSNQDLIEKPGYTFQGWIDKDNTIYTNGFTMKENHKVLYTKMDSNKVVTLMTYYGYLGVRWGDRTLEYEYKKAVTDQVISVYNTTGTFQYEILGVSGDVSGIDSLETTYGITLTATESGFLVHTDGGPTEVGNITVNVKVTDTEYTGTDATSSVEGTITIKVSPRTLVVNPPSTGFEKTYDGSASYQTDGTYATDVDGVTVNVKSGLFASPNAGTQKLSLYLDTANPINVPANEDVKHFTCGNFITVTGTIHPKQLVVRTTVTYDDNGRGYVRAGDYNQTYGVELVEGDLIDSDKNAGRTIKDYIEALYLFPENRNDELMLTYPKDRVYEVKVKAKEDSNYSFTLQDTGEDQFTVHIEEPIGRFTITNQGEEGWYGPNATIVPLEGFGYDMVRVEGDTAKSEYQLTEENTENNSITFQLYDSTTGAFTTYYTVPYIYVDTGKPIFESCDVAVNGADSSDGLYFPMEGRKVSFGHYFNKTITIRVRYKDERSNPWKLHYTLSGTLGSSSEAYFASADNTGVAEATIEIAVDALDKIGQIHFYAEDKAGNTSDLMELAKDGDEWAVEQTGPSVSNLLIKSNASELTDGITVVSGSDQYYSKCKASLSATDETSGIRSVTWVVNGVEYEEPVGGVGKQCAVDFSTVINNDKFPSKTGEYEFSVYVTDNAGNASTIQGPINFKVDDDAPVIDITSGSDEYQKEVKIEFSVYDEISGLKYINVKDENGNIIQHYVEDYVEENGVKISKCYVTTSKKGTYIIEASDYAGNVTQETVVIDKVSAEIPECPEVTVTPDANESGWITSKNAKATISNVTETKEDGTPVTTQYELWENETCVDASTLSSTANSVDVLIPDGEYKLHVWSESATGVFCEGAQSDSHIYVLKVDTKAPNIQYKLQKGSSSDKTMVTFTVTDSGSGVDKETIKVFRSGIPVTVQLTETENGYTGSFEITEVGSYSIQASDVAGNEADKQAFRPMSLKIYAMNWLSDSSVSVGAKIIKGTYDIKSASIAYRKSTDSSYTEADYQLSADKTNITAALDNLEQGVQYVYKITAVSEGNEVLEYEGYFRTLSDEDAGATVTGFARYEDNTKEGTITVSLYKGNVCVQVDKVVVTNDENSDNTFEFSNVLDGNYTIKATDNVYTKITRVLIQDGKIVYPDSDTVIDLVLSGESTDVVNDMDANDNINYVTAEIPDELFGNIIDLLTDEERELFENGEITVTLQLVASLQETTLNIRKLINDIAENRNKEVVATLDLTLYKIITYENGDVVKSKVTTTLVEPVTVAISLGDLANRTGLVVTHIHGGVAKNMSYEIYGSTLKITTNQFSPYAILADYVIEDGTTNPDSDGSINNSNDNDGDASDDNESDGNIEDIPADNNPPKSGNSSSVGSLKSSGSAKTGDAAPIAILFSIMLLSIGGVVILRKKSNEI